MQRWAVESGRWTAGAAGAAGARTPGWTALGGNYPLVRIAHRGISGFLFNPRPGMHGWLAGWLAMELSALLCLELES